MKSEPPEAKSRNLKLNSDLNFDARTRFVANLSHEIRTPLGIIMGFTDIALQTQISEADRTSALHCVRRNAESLSELVSDLLDLSRVEANRLYIPSGGINVQNFLEDIYDIFKERGTEKGLFFNLIQVNEKQNKIPNFVMTSPLRVRQVITNLVSNAIKFTARGGVTITCSAQPIVEEETDSTTPTIEQELDENPKRVQLVFRVQDSGSGISVSDQQRLFQPFFQADNSSTRQYGGTGIGLHLSKKIAEAMHGELNLVTSVLNKGSLFEFRVPVEVLTKKPALVSNAHSFGPVKNKMGSALRGRSVLVVDDSVENQILMQRILVLEGAKVTLALDGKTAIQAVEKNQFDLVLMDIQMPKMDGFQTTAALRKSGFSIPIVAVTAHALPEERARAFHSGFNDFLTKPLNATLLVQLAQRLTDPVAAISEIEARLS